MENYRIIFSECEHWNDLLNYEEDLQKSGAKILSASLNEDVEEGTVTIGVVDYKDFLVKFKKTDSFEFSHL